MLLAITELDIQRHDHGPRRDNRQTSRDPLLGISSKKRHVVATLHPSPTQATPKTKHPPGKLAIRPDLHAFLANRHQRRPPTMRPEPVDHGSKPAQLALIPPYYLTPINRQLFPLTSYIYNVSMELHIFGYQGFLGVCR
jgi:hypothetical protein